MQFADLPIDTIELALSYLDANCDRDTWARVGMALKNELGDAGFDVWDAWSRRGDNYDQRDARDTWRSIRATGGVTIATLIHMAKEQGYRPDAQPRTIDPAAAAARRAQREADAAREAAELAQRQERAAADAQAIWEAAQPATGHPYLTRKGITAPGKVRVGTYWRWFDGGSVEVEDALLIPIRTPAGQIASVQAIFPDAGNALERERDYLPGGRKQGCYFNIGMPTGEIGETVLIGEGYATCASAHMATDCMAVVAFDAGNLPDVAQAIRAKLPTARIVLLADNDRWGRKNTGVEKATEAARMVNGLVAIPKFASDDGQPTDFNDLHMREGLDAVRQQIEAAQLSPTTAANDNQPQQTADFPAPLDIFAEFPAPEIDPGMLPRVIADYANETADLIGVTRGMIAIPALVACAAALHDGVQIQPKRHERGWLESARLWCAIVGNPSVKKSPAIKRATRRLRKIDMDLHDQNARLQAEHAEQMEAFKEAKKEAKKSGAFIKAPEPPKLERMVVEDITVEALSEVLKDNDRGVLAIQDELSGWFGSMDAYSGNKAGSKDRAHWLEAYNGNSRVVDRVMRGTVKIPNWSVSMIGGIQPDAIRRIAQNMTDDGLMQRFMIVIGGNAPEHDRPSDDSVARAYGALIDHLHRVQPGSGPVTLTEEAHAIRERLFAFADSLVQYPALPGGLRSHLGKWSGLFSRLLLIYHAIECAGQSVHPGARQVSASTAEQVECLMRRFLLPHALAYYTDVLGASGDLEHARWIAGHILSKGLRAISNRDLVQAYKQWRGLDDWRRQRIMQLLEDMSWVAPVSEEGKTSRRGAVNWAVNPQVHDAFAQKAQAEAERRDKIRAEIAALQRM